jgi:hypothetical protein
MKGESRARKFRFIGVVVYDRAGREDTKFGCIRLKRAREVAPIFVRR